jgi:hypothetical protein
MRVNSSANLVHALVATTSSKKEAQRRLAQMGMGIVLALQKNEMTLEQCRKDLFNLQNYLAIRSHRMNRHLLEFMQWGMELEDVAELAPEGLEESYQRMITLARRAILESLPKARISNHKKRKGKSSKTAHAASTSHQFKRLAGAR